MCGSPWTANRVQYGVMLLPPPPPPSLLVLLSPFPLPGFASYFIDPKDASQTSLGPFAANPYFGGAKPEQVLLLEPGVYALRARVRTKYQGQIACDAWATTAAAPPTITADGSGSSSKKKKKKNKKKARVPVSVSAGRAPDFVAKEGPLGRQAWVSYTVCSNVPSPGPNVRVEVIPHHAHNPTLLTAITTTPHQLLVKS